MKKQDPESPTFPNLKIRTRADSKVIGILNFEATDFLHKKAILFGFEPMYVLTKLSSCFRLK